MEKIIGDEKVRNIYIHFSNVINNENIFNNFEKYDEKALNKLFNNSNILNSILNGEIQMQIISQIIRKVHIVRKLKKQMIKKVLEYLLIRNY